MRLAPLYLDKAPRTSQRCVPGGDIVNRIDFDTFTQQGPLPII